MDLQGLVLDLKVKFIISSQASTRHWPREGGTPTISVAELLLNCILSVALCREDNSGAEKLAGILDMRGMLGLQMTVAGS